MFGAIRNFNAYEILDGSPKRKLGGRFRREIILKWILKK
jgi:hypothetical protein